MPTVWDHVLNIIFPLHCEVCGAALSADNRRRLCSDCWEKILLSRKVFCPLPAIDGNIYLDQVRSVGKYEGILRQCIHITKYRKKPALSEALGELMVECLKRNQKNMGFDCIVPVPLYRRQLRKRGFNQSRLFADRISKHFGVPVVNAVLRTKATKPQYMLQRQERIANLTGAFRIKESQAIRGRAVLLVDDVYTTGTTAHECARVLREAGSGKVSMLALAHGD
ncbi:MAG: ComF family protein [bacterium]